MKLFAAGKIKPPSRAGLTGRDATAAHPPTPAPAYNRKTAGNVFFALFAAVAMVGAVGYGFNTVLRGPISGMTDVTRRTVAESTIVTSSRLAIVGATTQQTEADCDADGMVEPMPYRDAGTLPHPVGGGYLPTGLVPDSIDPWKTEYGYCAWDAGTSTVSDNIAGCGGTAAKRLDGSPNGTQYSIAIISAGKNKKFETTCNAYVDTTPADGKPDTPLVNKADGSDDIVLGYTYAEANDLGAGMWKPTTRDFDGDGTPDDVASTRNALEGTKGASFGGAVNLQGNLITGGGLVLPGDPGDDSLTGPCNAANDKQIRRNLSTVPPTLELCNFTGGLGWSPLSGAAGGGGGGGGGGSGMTGMLVSRWMLDETSGTVAKDSISGNHGTVFNSPVWTEQGVQNGALTFQASPVWQRINIPRAASLEPTAVSVALWVKRAGDQGWGQIINKASGGTPSYGLGFRADTGSAANFYYHTTAGDDRLQSNKEIPDGEWTHIIATYDPAADAPQMKLYINGALDVSKTETRTLAYDTSAAGGLFIAANGPNDWNASFNGTLDDIRIYNYALSDIEAHNIYNISKPVMNRNTDQSRSGQLVGWGYAYFGSFGDGTPWSTSIHTPTATINGRDFVQASLGVSHACAVKAGGTVWCSGYDYDGEGGNGDVVTDETKVMVKVKDLQNAVKVAVDNNSSCAITRDGEAWCWGLNDVGQLGNGSTNPSEVPVKVSAITDFVDISMNGTTTCGVRNNGEAWCWGANNVGQLGNNTTTPSTVPVKVSSITDFTTIDVGGSNTTAQVCGTRKNGTAYCWGAGTIGNGASAGAQVPTQVHTDVGTPGWSDWVDISVGYNFICGLRAGGSAWCWGVDGGGQLGNGATLTGTKTRPTLVQLAGVPDMSSGFTKISAGTSNACALRANGTVWCWGTDSFGNIGNGSVVTATQVSPSLVKAANIIDIDVGEEGAMAIMDTDVRPIVPIQKSSRIALGAGTASLGCTITDDGTAWCWGQDNYGQLGNGATTGTKTSPSRVAEPGPWAQIATGGITACGLKQDGTLWCWGRDDGGQLGNGAGVTADQPSPVAILPAERWSKISGASQAFCAIHADGSLWCWGNNNVGAGTANPTPTKLPTVANMKWIDVNVGLQDACAIAQDRTAWCWGSKTYGPLGDGGSVSYAVPTKIVDPGPWYDIATALWNTCGIKMDGTLWCWGNNGNGTLGIGIAPAITTYPMRLVAEPGPWVKVRPGHAHTCALKMNGSMWCWGGQSSGVLGNGVTSGYANYPVPVISDNNWVDMTQTVYTFGTCGIKKDGSVWCWGSDLNGLLGNGGFITADQSRPSRVATIPLRDPWVPSEHGGGFDLLPDVNAIVGTTRFISNDGTASRGLNFGASGRTVMRSSGLESQFTLESFSDLGAGIYDPDTGQMISTGSNIPSSQISFESASATDTGISGYTPNIVTFDNTDYLTGTLGSGASTDSDKLTMSFWFKIIPGSTQDTTIIYEGGNIGGRIQITLEEYFDGADNNDLWQMRLQAIDSSGTFLTIGDGSAIRSDEVITSGVWYNALISLDTTNLLANLYINDVSNIRNNNKTIVAGLMDFTSTQYIGIPTAGQTIGGDIADVWIDIGTYIDFSVEENRRKFINSAGGPVYLGANGELPTGTAPDIFLGNPYGTWNTNLGTAGNFAVSSGPLSAAVFPPANGTRAYAGVPIKRKVGTDLATSNFKIARDTGTAWLGGIDADIEVTPAGDMGIGTAGSPQAKLDVNGAIKIGDETTCGSAQSGTIKWDGTKMLFCNGSSWKDFGLFGGDTYWSDVGIPQDSGPCGIASTGAGYCWGYANNGKLGNNQSATNAVYPELVHTDAASTGWNDWKSISTSNASDYHTCGVRLNGTAWCWGSEQYGKLGNGVNGATFKLRPSQVMDSAGTGYWADWLMIESGYRHSCGVRNNGTAWCWGLGGGSGLLGTGNTTPSYSSGLPVQVQDNVGPGVWADWTKVSVGHTQACGLRTNGTLWCWGTAADGALGDNQTATDRPRPVQVMDSAGTGYWSDWTSVSSGRQQTCGLRTNGTAWCWGTNAQGGLGNGTNVASAIPVQVQTDTGPGAWSDWVQITSGYIGACGLRTNGTAWCWGMGFDGANGDNSASYRYNPVLVQTDTGPGGWSDWTVIRRGATMSCGLRTNGSLWCWGTGYFGNGAASSTIRRPVKVSIP